MSAASFAASPLAPGGIITIVGTNLADADGGQPSLPLLTTFNGTTVRIAEIPAPILYASNRQLNVVVPFGVQQAGNQDLWIQRDLTYSQVVPVDVAAAQPGIFVNPNDGFRAIVTDANYKPIGPGNPAHVGDSVIIWCAGLGTVSPLVADGAAAGVPLSNLTDTVTVNIGGVDAGKPQFTGLTPGLVGVYQINVTIPNTPMRGDQVPVVITTGGQTSISAPTSVQLGPLPVGSRRAAARCCGEKSSERSAGGLDWPLLFFRVAMIEQTAAVLDHIGEKSLDRHFPQ